MIKAAALCIAGASAWIPNGYMTDYLTDNIRSDKQQLHRLKNKQQRLKNRIENTNNPIKINNLQDKLHDVRQEKQGIRADKQFLRGVRNDIRQGYYNVPAYPFMSAGQVCVNQYAGCSNICPNLPSLVATVYQQNINCFITQAQAVSYGYSSISVSMTRERELNAWTAGWNGWAHGVNRYWNGVRQATTGWLTGNPRSIARGNNNMMIGAAKQWNAWALPTLYSASHYKTFWQQFWPNQRFVDGTWASQITCLQTCGNYCDSTYDVTSLGRAAITKCFSFNGAAVVAY